MNSLKESTTASKVAPKKAFFEAQIDDNNLELSLNSSQMTLQNSYAEQTGLLSTYFGEAKTTVKLEKCASPYLDVFACFVQKNRIFMSCREENGRRYISEYEPNSTRLTELIETDSMFIFS